MYHFGSGSCLTGADLTDLERIAKVPQQHSRRTTENKNIGNIGEYHVYYIKRVGEPFLTSCCSPAGKQNLRLIDTTSGNGDFANVVIALRGNI